MLRCVQAIALCLPALALAGGQDIEIHRKTAPGREVTVRGFAEFDGNCRLRNVQRIQVVDAPAHGTVETRPGVVTIGKNWVGDTHCEGTKLDGVFVYYKPADGFTGTDRFSFDVDYMKLGRVRATVDVQVALPQ